MNATTVAASTGHQWVRRAGVGLAALALFGPVGFGLANGNVLDQLRAEDQAAAAHAAPPVSERYRTLKMQQAEQQANMGSGVSAPVSRAVPQRDIDLHDRQPAQRLGEGNANALSSARQRFKTMKEQQALQAADAMTTASAVTERYRGLKHRQVEQRQHRAE